jgi:hypothetical protein
MHKLFAGALLGLAGWAALTSSGRGQGFGGGDYERGLRPGVLTPYDGINSRQRYSFDTGTSVFYLNMSSQYKRDLLYQDYLDKLDRAQKFGYRPPQDPYFSGAADRVSRRPGPFGFGLGFGFFGWR